MTSIIIAATALAFTTAIVAPASPALAQSSEQRVTAPKKKPVKRAPRTSSGGGQIACTAAGCHPIPRNCRPQTGYRWNGMPSGFDVVVCR